MYQQGGVKVDRLISEKAVMESIVETIKHKESVNDLLGRILAIPSAEPTNEQVKEYSKEQGCEKCRYFSILENACYYNGKTLCVHDDVNELPFVTPQQTMWIPVSERLPEEGVDVLACFYTGKGNYKMMVSSRFNYNYWSGVGRTGDMVAWMSLPEPYKEGVSK